MNEAPPHRNQLWADVLVAELARGGLAHVALSPGHRSAPLAVAFHRHPRITVSVHPDERSGAFYALGRARQTGHPVATLTTSGTAVVNQHPAIVEAHHALVPLLVISADRPPHLHAVGANQTLEQSGLFERHTNWSHSLGLPQPNAKSLRYLRAVVARALGHARGPPPGPVHLNVPFDEPLSPDPLVGDVPVGVMAEPGGAPRPDYLPWIAASGAIRWPDPALVDLVASRIAGKPGVIVVGPRQRSDALPALLLRLARNLGAPIIADPLSGVRYLETSDGTLMGTADAFLSLDSVREALAPQWFLQFGATPTSIHVQRYFEQYPQALRVAVDESGRHPDPVATAQVSVAVDAPRFALMLERRIAGNGGGGPKRRRWLDAFRDLEKATRKALEQEGDWEATVPRRALAALPSGGLLFVGSSLPVRDLDRYAPPFDGSRRVLGNRGVSGIDGSISSAVGAAAGHGGPSIAVVGDVAFSHDAPALAAMKKYTPGLTLIVINNGGGAIFGELPIAKHEPPFSELFLTPPELDLKRLAEGYGLRHRLVGEGEPLTDMLRQDPGGVVEVAVDRERSHHRRALIRERLRDAVKKAIG